MNVFICHAGNEKDLGMCTPQYVDRYTFSFSSFRLWLN